MERIVGRCALCRCKAVQRIFGIKVCRWHVTRGESDPPCPYCHRSFLFDPRWTYTVNGEAKPAKVEMRQARLPGTIFFDNTTEVVIEVEAIPEPARRDWPQKVRQTVIMIGIGQQLDKTFVITQWASDWERELLDAARPSIALASRVFDVTFRERNARLLCGQWPPINSYDLVPYWPTIVKHVNKTYGVHKVLQQQEITSYLTEEEKETDSIKKLWTTDRERLWQMNFKRVLDSSRRVFQIEWPVEDSRA